MKLNLHGSLVALITPMHENGDIDNGALKTLIDYHVDNGTDGIVIAGTTGESCTLSFSEHESLLKQSVEYAAGRIRIIAGPGANSTQQAVHLTEVACEAGATACLSVAPYYNRPTQEGLHAHFSAIADAAPIPTILYNVPGRTASDIHNDTVARLAEHPNIIGIKDATGDMVRAADLARIVPSSFLLFSGDDLTSLPYLLLGGTGIISVTANIAPRHMAQLCSLVRQGAVGEALRLHLDLMPLHHAMFCETNPIPVKAAVAHARLCKPALRLPLTPLSDKGRTAVLLALEQLPRAAGVDL